MKENLGNADGNGADLGRELQDRRLMRTLPPTLFFSVLLAPFAAGAVFHFWDITEVYSNDDGSVQFIELLTTSNNQDELINHTLVSGLATFTFPTDLDPDEMGNGNGATAGRHMLVATPAFASQPGAVTPDFVLDGPDFFDFVEDSIDFAGVNTFALGLDELPINGVDSLHEPFGSNVRTLNINSPTNFAGEFGVLPEPSGPLMLGVGACVLALLRRVSGQG